MSILPDPRPTCYRCWKPESTCVCATIQQVDNRTGVIVLQHPREHAQLVGRLQRDGTPYRDEGCVFRGTVWLL